MPSDLRNLTTLRIQHGQLRVDRWPGEVPVPFGLRPDGTRLVGPPRMRAIARLALQDARVSFRDCIETRSDAFARSDPPPAHNVDPLLTMHTLADNRGVVHGIEERRRVELVVDMVGAWQRSALVLVPDSAVAERWRRELDGVAGGSERRRAIEVGAVGADAAASLVAIHDLLFVDAAEMMPRARLLGLLDRSVALGRIGFVDSFDARLVEQLAPRLGAVLHCSERRAARACHEFRVPLPVELREDYEVAWHRFLSAYDQFVAIRPDAGFHTFVAEARRTPAWRPALEAWHRANRIASWHDNKVEVVFDLLGRHDARRTLVFTPTRAAAYQLGEELLVPVVTGEVPLAERRALVDLFVAGELPALAGPRLLDMGVPEGIADVAILAGGGFGAWQRTQRTGRVRSDGYVFEINTLDTLEVGRAHRARSRTAAESTAVVDRRW